MKKSILKLGKALGITEQKNTFGGRSHQLVHEGEGGCLSAGNLCHNYAGPSCCGSCEGGRWGICS